MERRIWKFPNLHFTGMCDDLGINIDNTAAKSLWSNNIVHFHNKKQSDCCESDKQNYM